MGQAYDLKCNRCGYETTIDLGVGFLYAQLYIETIDRIRKGQLGETLQRFLQEHPDGAIDCEWIALKCENCGTLKDELSLDMYIPKPGCTQPQHRIRSTVFPFEDASYVNESDLQKNYDLYEHYPHRCPGCGNRMQTLDLKEFERQLNKHRLHCPNCKAKIKKASILLWD